MPDLHADLAAALAAHYALGDEIGRGGMANVYGADDLRHGRRVAIKVLSPDASASRGVERFLREVRLTAGLSHPHIVPVFDSGEVAGQLYFVMPLIEGETLRARLRREGRLPVAAAVRVAREVAEALEYAHGRGIVHRDVKPENILLANGHALLADFGIARSDGVGAEALTGTGMFIGTPEYLSPEQVTGDAPAGTFADVYALGCVLYEMLTGSPPFRGATPQATLARRLSGAAPRVRELRPEVPTALETAVTQALATDPARRTPGCGALAAAIAAAMAGDAVSAIPDVSLVVRPFDAVGGDRELGEFADGITEEVIGALSKIRALRVISRASAVRLKGSSKTIRELGSEYAVRYVVTGSVRRAGSKVRVACEVVDAVLDASVWSDRVDGTFDDPFALQEGVARAIAAALHVQLTAADEARLATRPVPDPRAADCARQAFVGVMSFTRDGLERGEALARQGLAIVGDNAQLFTALGMAEFQRVNAGYETGDHKARIRAAREWLDRALALDPDCADAHFVLGWIAWSSGDVPEGYRRVDRSLTTDLTHANSLAMRIVLSALLGRTDALREDLLRLEALDPFDVWGIVGRGWERSYAGDAAGRDAAFARAIAVAPAALVCTMCAVTQAADGDIERALATWSERSDGAVEEDLGAELCRAGIAALRGSPEPALALAQSVAASAQFRLDPQWGCITAQILALAGANEAALETLERAVNCGYWNVTMLGGRDATLRALHGDPRYAALVERATRELAALEAELGATAVSHH